MSVIEVADALRRTSVLIETPVHLSIFLDYASSDGFKNLA